MEPPKWEDCHGKVVPSPWVGTAAQPLHSSRQPARCGWTPFQHLPSLTATFLVCWGQPMGPGLGLRQSLHRPAERRAASTIPFSFCSPKLRGSSGATVLGLAPSSPTMGAAVVTPTYPPIHFLSPPLGRNSQAGSGESPSFDLHRREIGRKAAHHYHHRWFRRLAPATGGGPDFLRPTGREVKRRPRGRNRARPGPGKASRYCPGPMSQARLGSGRRLSKPALEGGHLAPAEDLGRGSLMGAKAEPREGQGRPWQWRQRRSVMPEVKEAHAGGGLLHRDCDEVGGDIGDEDVLDEAPGRLPVLAGLHRH